MVIEKLPELHQSNIQQSVNVALIWSINRYRLHGCNVTQLLIGQPGTRYPLPTLRTAWSTEIRKGVRCTSPHSQSIWKRLQLEKTRWLCPFWQRDYCWSRFQRWKFVSCAVATLSKKKTSISSTNSSSSTTHIGSSSSISRNTDFPSETYDHDQSETSTPTSAPGDNDNDLKRTSKAVR
jgi:hypothetical protein